MVALNFSEWLFQEERSVIDRAVLDGYEREFQRQLDALAQRTRAPELQQTIEAMKKCGVRDSNGRCHRFTDYIVGGLLRHQCNRRIDLDDALQQICFHMLSRVGEKGQPRRAVFDFDENRPFDLARGNPLEAIFKQYLLNDLRSICGGRISRLRITNRPHGTVSIEQGHGKDANAGMVSPDEIPAKPPSGEEELFQDIHELLRRNSTPTMPLADLWAAMLEGMPLKKQRATFGHTKADTMRKTIKTTLRDYAARTQNLELLRLLDKFADYNPTRPDPNSVRQRRLKRPKKPKSNLPPDVQDYMSIIDVIEKAGGRASMMVLGKKRRRWLERKPRDPKSPHGDRLHDVLARMVADGVLAKHGAAYVAGPSCQQFKTKAQAMAAGVA